MGRAARAAEEPGLLMWERRFSRFPGLEGAAILAFVRQARVFGVALFAPFGE